ncbi:Glycosyltransferase involved in cell wall bisynthesis [Mucilaginibacter pineti]|uniref:Glycosyltransferase involved in cell wall bisynthesis n=1 Tax=Mucilaginibacter pineti TaxID=1391627 RepID=A0A1G6ZMX7_9SPHI|nr:glycosyltransferase family 4 protein [Mucilaginibacter pineti]SDE03567.1 Glycosyltransferase involved in cell wall bisynthesis [Mucilaginibacter pineti]
MKNKKILFVLHDAAMMGAPMVILHFLRWLNVHDKADITILLKCGGPLEAEFEKIAPVYIWRPGMLPSSIYLRGLSAFRKVVGRKGIAVPFPPKLKSSGFDLVYLNTADTMELGPLLKGFYQCRLLAHIHELSYSLNAYFSHAFSLENQNVVDGYIAASDSVRLNIQKSYGIPSERINVINEFIPVAEITRPDLAPLHLKKELGLTASFIVGAAGQAGWRKGTDLFIRLAAVVNKLLPDNDIVFMWVGHQSTEVHAQIAYEIERLQLAEKICFTGQKNVPQNYFQLFDLFALMSREDPFPLVSLEAAALSKPILCFRDTGGIPEIIDDTTGGVFAYDDVTAMAECVITFYKDRPKVQAIGRNAAKLVQQYDVDILAPKLLAVINAY